MGKPVRWKQIEVPEYYWISSHNVIWEYKETKCQDS